jgi:hypothetical protein
MSLEVLREEQEGMYEDCLDEIDSHVKGENIKAAVM